jgi:hypothetical protein
MSEELKDVSPRRRYTTKDVTVPKSGLVVNMGSFWICEDGDPTKALFFGQSAQCNKDKRICEWTLNGYYKGHDNLQIVFIEYAYVPQVD